MARIRTIKPAFFRHEGLQDLEAANPGKCIMLVFAGLWGHCDKAGRFVWQPRQLKLDILPFIAFDMHETLAILLKAGFITRYEAAGKHYGTVPTFLEHQRISGKEAQEPETHPAPPETQLGSTGEAPKKRPRRQEEEGKGVQEEEEERSSVPSERLAAEAEIPLAVDAWNELAERIGLPRMQRLTGARRAKLAARLRDGGGIVGWQCALEKVAASPLLNGTAPRGKGHENWQCDIDFLLSEEKFTRLMEGKYDDRSGVADQSTRSRENAAILEGLGIKPDQRGGADPAGESGDGGSRALCGEAPDSAHDAGDPGRGTSQAGRLGEGVQRAGQRPENRRAGVQRGAGPSAVRPDRGGVQIDQGGPQMGHEAPAAERDSGDRSGPDGGTPAAAGQAGDSETLPDGEPHETAAHGSGETARGRDHEPVAEQPGFDRERALVETRRPVSPPEPARKPGKFGPAMAVGDAAATTP